MRISTGMIYDSGLSSIQGRTSSLLRTQQQVSAGRRILNPSDDPVAAARALEVTQAKEVNLNQAATRNNAKSSLGLADTQLQSATDLMARIRELTVQAGSASLTAADRRYIAMEIRARYDELLGLANSRDGTGQYLFGGYQTGNKPFAGSVENGVHYAGDDGVRTLGVSGSRDLAISNSGNDAFMRVKNGNGVFATGMQNEKSANADSVVYESSLTALANPPANTGDFELRFWVDTAGGVTTSAQAVGTVDLNALGYPLVIADGAGDQFTITLDGAGIPVDLAPGAPTAYASSADLVAAIQNAVGAAGYVNLDTNGQLVITSASGGAGSTVALAEGNGALATLMGGAPTITSPGTVGAANTTYFDLVDANGDSLFTGTPSTTGIGGTYNHAYVPGTALDLSNAGPNAFDFGATVYFTGKPQSEDTFTVSRTANSLAVTAKSLALGAQAVIDQGSVTDPLKWNNPANGGNYELRFWVDTQGVIATTGQAVGSVSLPPNITVVAGDEQFSLGINGGAPQLVTLTPGAYATPAAFASHVQARVNAALGVAPPAAGSASVTLDSDNRLVVTSTTPGAASAVNLIEGNGALAAYFGTPTATAGTAALAGRTFYDLVDPDTGNSVFTGSTSTTGAGGTYDRIYVSGNPIALSSSGGPGKQTFDYGANVTVTGTPANGDTFVIAAGDDPTGNGFFTTEPKRSTQYNTGSGIIGVGEVLNEGKWNSPANSRNLEIRFWKDPDDPQTTYYDLVDSETERSLFTNSTSTAGGLGNTYTHVFKPDDSIEFSGLHTAYGEGGASGDFGISVTIQGEPASGDAFSIQASETESVFASLGRLIEALEENAPPETSGNTFLANKIANVLNQVTNIEDNFLRVRASIGTRLAEIDSLDTVGENLNLQYEETLSRLQDLDYAEAITKLTREQVELQAAQQSFTRIAQLSLFNYL